MCNDKSVWTSVSNVFFNACGVKAKKNNTHPSTKYCHLHIHVHVKISFVLLKTVYTK